MIDLCKPCYAAMRSECELRRVRAGADMKITCSRCGRRRYGATYERVRVKKEKE